MHKFYKIGSFFGGVLLLLVTAAYGQVNQETYLHDIGANGFPVGFRAGLHWNRFMHNNITYKASHTFTYHIDTAIVYSNYVNPQRYTYTYDSADNQTTSLIALTTNGNWENVSMDTATYDSVRNKLTDLTRIWNNNQWENSSLTKYMYTNNHNVVSKVSQQWVSNIWQKVDSSHFTYDINDNELASYHAVWVDTLSAWQNDYFNLFAYDSLGRQTLSLYESWNDSVWRNGKKATYTYDSASNLIQGLIQNWTDTSWAADYIETYTYDSLHHRISYIGQFWNDSDSTWEYDQHYEYTYNSLGQLESGIGEVWKDTLWVRYDKGIYTYDTYGGIETYLNQNWNDTVWADISLSQYNYDSAGNAYLGNYFTWNTTGNLSQNQDGVLQIFYNYSGQIAYFTGYQVVIKYNAPLSTGINKKSKSTIAKYRCVPNPVFDHASIQLGLETGEKISLNLFSLTGKRVSVIYNGSLKKGSHRFKVPVSQLSSGIYIASLLSGNNTKNIKIVVRK